MDLSDRNKKEVREVARILYAMLDSMTVLVRHHGDPDAVAIVEDLRDELKPTLDWAIRYGSWFDEETDPLGD